MCRRHDSFPVAPVIWLHQRVRRSTPWGNMARNLGNIPIQTAPEHPPFPSAHSACPCPHFAPPHIPMPHGAFLWGVQRATSPGFRPRRARVPVRTGLESPGGPGAGPPGSLPRWQQTRQYAQTCRRRRHRTDSHPHWHPPRASPASV